MVNRKLILVSFFILLISVTNVFYSNFLIPFKATGDMDISKVFGTTRNSETDIDKRDNSNSSSDSDSNSSSDSDSNSSSDSNTDYISPIADAGTDIAVQSNISTKLDGSKSYDPNNSGDDVRPPLSFDWTQTGGPEVTLNNPKSANPSFTSPQVEEETRLTFQLVVSSDTATSDPDSVTVCVTPDTPPETPDTSPETPDTPPETPDTPPETPDTPPETPIQQEFQTTVKDCGP